MSKRHQASRRRSYGRREHELHERPDLRIVDGVTTQDAGLALEPAVARLVADQLPGRFAFRFVD